MYGVVWPWSAHIVGIALGLNLDVHKVLSEISLLPPRLSCPSLLASEPAALVLLPTRLSRPSLLASVPAALVLLPPGICGAVTTVTTVPCSKLGEMDVLLAQTVCHHGACVVAGPSLFAGEPAVFFLLPLRLTSLASGSLLASELLATELLATKFFVLPPGIGGALKLNAAPCESHAFCVVYIPAASEAAPFPSQLCFSNQQRHPPFPQPQYVMKVQPLGHS